MAPSIDIADLDHILDHTSEIWEEIRGRNLFITGGTGFFGCWLLESFICANDRLDLGAKAFVLSRNPDAFSVKAPHISNHQAINLLKGDVQSFKFPPGEFTHIIHAATDASTRLNEENPLLMLETIIQGTRRTLEFAHTHGARKTLFVSSGAVYGKQTPDIILIKEDYLSAPDIMNPISAYGEGKRSAEMLCRLYASTFGMEIKIARCFALLGPYMPLDAHYAIGNFIRDAFLGKSIHVNGDGTPSRSYIYAADVTIWLWTILFKGKSCYPYNVGSEKSITIKDLAHLVRQLVNTRISINIAQHAVPLLPPERYVPATARAREELALESWVSLEQSIIKTIKWLRSNSHE